MIEFEITISKIVYSNIFHFRKLDETSYELWNCMVSYLYITVYDIFYIFTVLNLLLVSS